LLGVVFRVGSYLDLSKQTKRRRWQHLIHWKQRISDDAFHYVSERFYVADLRSSLVRWCASPMARSTTSTASSRA